MAIRRVFAPPLFRAIMSRIGRGALATHPVNFPPLPPIETKAFTMTNFRRRSSIAAILGAAACLLAGGCVEAVQHADRMVWTYHWGANVVPVVAGLALWGVALMLISGHWSFKGKPRVLGVFLAMFGTAGLVLVVTQTLGRVTVSEDELLIEGGLLVREVCRSVEFADVKILEVWRARVDSRSGGRRRRSGSTTHLSTLAIFKLHDGSDRHVFMESGLIGPALEPVMHQVTRHGGAVVDYRDRPPLPASHYAD